MAYRDEYIQDRIEIHDLRTRCIIGFNPEERIHKQDVSLDITLYTNTQTAAASDTIDDAVDYKAIKKRVLSMVENSSFNLLEKLTEETAEICLQDPRIHHADISIKKIGALRYAHDAAVHITRFREAPERGT